MFHIIKLYQFNPYMIGILDDEKIILKFKIVVQISDRELNNSREVMGARFYTSKEVKHVFKVMRGSFSKNGLPKHMIQDRGTQFRSTFGRGLQP